MTKNFLISTAIVLLLFSLGIVLVSSDNMEHLPLPENTFENKYGIFPVPEPDSPNFAGEPMPLELFDVKESFDKELLVNTYWQSQMVMFLKKAPRYFSIIEPILKEYGIPDDFKYLAVAESGLSNVTSPAGAKGFWQILKDTGKELNLEINDHVDERLNLEKATHAACKYIRKSYENYGSWTMAAASYNMGRRNVSNQIQRQKSDFYYDLVLGDETGRYIYRIVAIKTIIENPQSYGFWVKPEDKYPIVPFTKVQVDSSIQNLADFANHFETNYKVLKELNPWLRDNYLPNNSRKQYTILIPEKGFRPIQPSSRFYPNDSVPLSE